MGVKDRALDLLLATARWAYPAGRAIGRAAGINPSRHPHLGALAQAILDPYARADAFDSAYASGADHWGYTNDPVEAARHRLAIELLGQAVGKSERFGRVLEIGCAEGVFTEMLAPLCESLLAVDFSEIALERARRRCSQARNVSLSRFDLRRDPLPGHFDLVVVMDVLSFIHRPARLEAVLEKLIAGLGEGDLLLAGDYRWGKLLENSSLGRRLVFGGKWVIEKLTARPDLETIARTSTDSHLFALLRKIQPHS
jgi:SAM-dependent methyltransferase